MKNITRLLCAGAASLALALGLAGCEQPIKGTYKGYAVELFRYESNSYIAIYSNGKRTIEFQDDYRQQSDGRISTGSDGKFESLKLVNLKEGYPLADLASLAVANKIFQELTAVRDIKE